MSLIGSSWKEDYPSDEEVGRFEKITGEKFYGSTKELKRRIEKSRDSGHSSRKETSDLLDLGCDMDETIES